MIQSRRSIMVLLLAAAMAASACQARPAATVQQLQTATVTRGALQATVSASGTIAAHAQVAVPFQNAGQVKTINVKVGDTVKSGQVLASLDTTDLDAAVTSAQAGLDMAQAKLAAAKKAPLPSEIQA